MASPRVSRSRPLLALALFLAAWWLVPAGVRTFTRASFYTLEAPVSLAYSRWKDLQDFWVVREHSKQDLLEAGRDVAHQNAEMSLQLEQMDALGNEVRRLEEISALPPEPGFRYEIARVIRRDETTWWQQIVIRKGTRDGIQPGQGVVFSGGVVGRVIKPVDEFTAVVQLASSPEFRVAANLGGDAEPVIYEGNENGPFQPPVGEVRASLDFTLPPAGPARLVSSSLGGEFPQGVTIGSVDKLEPGSDGLSRLGRVKLDARLNNLDEVAVLVPLPESSLPPPPVTPAPLPSQPAGRAASPTRPATNR